jgi:hypothetical protein
MFLRCYGVCHAPQPPPAVPSPAQRKFARGVLCTCRLVTSVISSYNSMFAAAHSMSRPPSITPHRARNQHLNLPSSKGVNAATLVVGGEKCSMVYFVWCEGPGVEPEPSRVAGPRKTLKQQCWVVEVHCLFKLSAPLCVTYSIAPHLTNLLLTIA